MHTDTALSPSRPDTSIATTIAQHGAARVLAASFLALVRAPVLRPPPPGVDTLDDHLRRDVGLPPRRAGNPRFPPSPFLS